MLGPFRNHYATVPVDDTPSLLELKQLLEDVIQGHLEKEPTIYHAEHERYINET